jgi:hypothetical protein
MGEVQAIERVSDAVNATMTYTLHKPERLAYRIAEMGGDEDSPDYHAWYDDHQVAIHDMRSAWSGLSLDREGFVLRQFGSAVSDFYDPNEVEAAYNPEVERLIKHETGAEKVLVFDHTIRIESDEKRRERMVRETVKLAHNDYTEKSGPQRVRDLLPPDEAERRLHSRFAFYNLWRPINGPVLSAPLALCDARSVAWEDWVICDLVYEDRIGEIYNIAFNPEHRWCYFPRMTNDEVLVFKCYDSLDDGRARFTAHSAFDDPTTPPDAKPRESIETRVAAFFAANL